ncbi:hypothetical protein GGD63_006072 [Bradyrhizobium sp. cir1]|uniref:hypothetical protein n=1 Tax=Bradyrhizobium sp. cir1 TaxID=1445730 RepID=UPI0017F77A8C|nr:hypothetical protein [Bradyrhizobium sp. cir1]MBB4373250.1 hypothetical protein [Bradyrhizobium sp. cir1]
MFGRSEIDLYATNKPTLFDMSDQMPGAKILDGNWGLEHMAIAIPKGREDALPLLNRFVTEEQSNAYWTRSSSKRACAARRRPSASRSQFAASTENCQTISAQVQTVGIR